MGAFVFTDAFVSVDGNDISDHVKSVTINYSSELQDDTVMGDDTRSRLGGLKDWSMDIEALNDFASSQIDAILFPLVGTTFTVIIRPVNTGGVSSTNPNYTGTGILESYNPLGGSVGDLAMTTPTIQSAGTLSRATM